MEEDDRKINEWLQFQKELLQEKDFLTNLLSKIDKQIHALQVEQLHLLNTINTKNSATTDCTNSSDVTCLPSTSNGTVAKQAPLDLSVPVLMELVEEEENEDNSPDESDEEWK